MQRKPVVTEVRTPTDTWSGLGFSKSMPAEALKELRNISRRSYKPYLSNTSQTPVEQKHTDRHKHSFRQHDRDAHTVRPNTDTHTFRQQGIENTITQPHSPTHTHTLTQVYTNQSSCAHGCLKQMF